MLLPFFQSYDKCFLGSSETADANRVFCGQLGAIYVFSEALNPAQIFAIHQLGPGYKVSQHHLINHCTVYSLSLYASVLGGQNFLATERLNMTCYVRPSLFISYQKQPLLVPDCPIVIEAFRSVILYAIDFTFSWASVPVY